MDIALIILSGIFIIVGIISSIVPVLPATILGFIGLLLLHFTSTHPFSWTFLLIWAAIVGAIVVIENYLPIWGTKKYGGTKAGVRGSTVGLIVSVVVLPILGITIGPLGLIGLIAGPFLGAYIGEKVTGKEHHHALRSAVGSFIGFLAGSGIKLIVCIVMAGYFFVNVYSIIIK